MSEHIVKPLARLAGNAVSGPGLYFGMTPDYPVPSGFVDFVFEHDDAPALAIEVKLTVLTPASGVWADSRDFQQLRRYMSDLDLPGLLVDAQRLLLVRRGADAPFAEIVRSEATWGDIALIRELLLEVTNAERIHPTLLPTRTRRLFRRGNPLELVRPEGAPSASDRDSRTGQFQVREDSQWVSEYDYSRRVASLTLCNGPDVAGSHWSGIALSKSLSDPEGRFQVYVAERADGQTSFRPDDDSRFIVKIVAALDDDGGLLAPHPNFDQGFIGSYTIWPYRDVGERFGLDHWLWWQEGWPFYGEPRNWSEAAEAAAD